MKNIYTLSKIKNVFPRGYLFFFIFMLSKTYGSLIISTLTRYKIQQESIYFKFFNFSTFFSLHMLNLDNFPVIYESLCFIIYFYLIILMTFIAVLLVNKSKESKQLICFSSKEKKSKQHLTTVVSVLFTITALISQYLIEILSVPICLLISIKVDQFKLRLDTAPLLYVLVLSLRVNYYFYLVMNSILIVLLNVFVVFYVKLLNNVHLSNKRLISITPNNPSIIFLVLAQNMQLIHYYYLIFTSFTCILILNVVALVYFFIAIVVFIYQLTDLNFCNGGIFFAYLFCFFGSVVSIIYNKYEDTELTVNQVFFQFIFQFGLTVLCICLLYLFKMHMFHKKLPSFLFKYNKKFDYHYIEEFMLFIRGCLYNMNHISSLFSLILSHQERCESGECDCTSINVTELRTFIRGSKLDNKPHKSSSFKPLFDIILIIENVLMNYINALGQSKLLTRHLTLIVFHCNYIFYFKKNFIYSLYIIDEYLAQLSSMPFEYKVYLHSFKKKALKSFNKKTKKTVNEGSYIVKCNKFVLYYNHLFNIRKQIKEASSLYAKILYLKRILCECKAKSSLNNSSSQSQTSSYIKLLFLTCGEYNVSVKKIERSLEEYYHANDNEPICNQEICYIITNFLILTNRVNLNEKVETFIPTEMYFQKNNAVSYYSEIQFIHPMILSIKTPSHEAVRLDSFKEANGLCIEYISQQMLDILGYKKSEIIKEEIKKLIPHFFAEKQTNILQSHFFIHKKVEIELMMLLITKDSYFKRALGIIGSFPTLMNCVLLICNIDILDKDSSSNRFRFVLDVNGKIITFTENFAKKYWLTYQMIHNLRITFTSLFGINMEKLCFEFKKAIENIKESDSLSIEKYINILSACKLSDFLAVHSHKTPNEVIKEEEEKTFIITKEKKEIKRLVYAIRKEVEEKEVEADWFSRLKSLESSLNEHFHENSLNFEIMLQHIGNIPYFIAVVNDEVTLDTNSVQSMMRKKGMVSDKNLGHFDFNFLKEAHSSSGIRKVSVNAPVSYLDNSGTLNFSIGGETKDKILSNQASTLISMKEIRQLHSSVKTKSRKMQSKVFNDVKEARLIKAQKIVITLFDQLLFVFLKLLSLVIVIIHIIQTVEEQSNFTSLKDLSLFTINSLCLKEMYYDTIGYYSSLCFRIDGLEPEEAFDIKVPNEEIFNKIIESAAKMSSYLNMIIKTVNSLHHEEERNELFNILYDIIPYKGLKKNWVSEVSNSSVEQEIAMIHYHMGVLRKKGSGICRVREKFINNEDLAELGKGAEKDDQATIEEILLFSYLFNSLSITSERMNRFIVKATEFQRKVRIDSSALLIKYNVTSMSLMCLEMIVFTVLIVSYQKKLIKLLYIFITKTPRINYQEVKMAAFIKVIHSFDETTCNSYETVVYTPNEKERNNPQLTTRGKTSTSASFQRKSVHDSGNIKLKDDESNDLATNSIKASIQLISIYFAVIAVFLVLYLLIAVIGLINHLNTFQNLKLTHDIGRIYMSSIPRFNEIIAFYKFSIILHDPSFDTLDLADYHLYDYSKSEYFTLETNLDKDTRYQQMGTSTMAFLFKKYQEEIEIMKKYNQNSQLTILPKARSFQNEPSCEKLVAALTYFSFGGAESVFSTIARLNKNCNDIANGVMNKGGLQINLENSAESLLNLFIEFIQTKDKSKHEAFLRHPDYILAVYEIQQVFVYMFFTMSEFVIKDTSNFFNDFHQIIIVFDVLRSIVIAIVITAFIFIMFPKLLSFYRTFKDIVECMEISLVDDQLCPVPFM